MKVVKIINSLHFGGIEKVFEIVARYYEGDKQDLVFVAIGAGGATAAAIREMGYKVVVLDRVTRIPNMGIVSRLVSLLRKEKPDAVHTTGAEANFHGLLAAFIVGVPVRVAEEIGMPAHSKRAKWVFRQVYRLSTKVIGVAGMVGDFLVESGEVPGHKMEVIYNPVDTDAFSNITKEWTDPVFRIVVVCRLDPIKNLPFLLDGFKDLLAASDRDRLALDIVGDGGERGALEDLALRLRIADRVTFHGYQERPARFFERASLFVLPSLSEGLPVSLIEAMLTGTLCIATKNGGPVEFIREGENGWLIDPHDREAFVLLLKDVVRLPLQERRDIAEKGRAMAQGRFNPPQYLERVNQLYQSK